LEDYKEQKLMNESEFNQNLMNFLRASPTPFHAVAQMSKLLEKSGFQRISESDTWDIQKNSRYYVTRNDSSLIAFTTGTLELADTGICMMGAHTDSPCLKVKPAPELFRKSYLQLGVEVYGGALLNPWFDRDLSLAGRVTYLSKDQKLRNALVDFEAPVAFIPSLAVHFDREANNNRKINAQTDLPPLLLQIDDDQKPDFKDILLEQLKKQYPDCGAETVLDDEISLYDTQPPSFVGMKRDFIAAARLDNLLSCYTGLTALTDAGNTGSNLAVFNDHEEVGSTSAAGAQGSFLESVLRRLNPSPEDFARTIDRSAMISSDNAHGVHPNYADKYDENHSPVLNRGPVIKINGSQRYASNSETSGLFRYLCQKAGVPVQVFVMRSDMGCGSTIGPMTSGKIGVKTVDVGVPTFGMHSIRELAGTKDAFCLYKALKCFFDLSQKSP
jgi:aspartyl aminopeptidase